MRLLLRSVCMYVLVQCLLGLGQWDKLTHHLDVVDIGEVDMQVHSALSHLNGIAPHPHNMSAESPISGLPLSLPLSPKEGYMRYAIKTLLSLVSPSAWNKEDVESNASSHGANGAVDTGDVAADMAKILTKEEVLSSRDSKLEVDRSTPTAYPTAPSNLILNSPKERFVRSSHPYSSITMDNWQLHMAPYIDPPHVSIRTSQMPEVGFPVDHKALLWCNQVLQSVNAYMHAINIESKASVDMSSVVPVRPEYRPEVPTDDVIPPLASYLLRNASLGVYVGKAVDDERSILRGILSNSTLWLMATVYNVSFATTILTCYMLVPLLVIASAMLFEVTGKAQWALHDRPKSEFDALMPANHLFLGVFDDLWMILSPQTYRFVCSKASFLWPPLMALVAYRMVTDLNHPALFFKRYSVYFQWALSYGVAIAIHVILLGAIMVIRSIFAFLARSVYAGLRWTVWCDFVRHRVKGALKPLRKSSMANLDVLLLVSVAMGSIAMGFYCSGRVSGTAGRIMHFTSICFLVLAASFLVIFAAAVLWKPKGSSKLLFAFLALYAPMVVLMAPSASYCLTIILGDLQMVSRMSSVHEIFGPQLIHYTLCLACIVCHLTHSLR